jgi:hypothetical protein
MLFSEGWMAAGFVIDPGNENAIKSPLLKLPEDNVTLRTPLSKLAVAETDPVAGDAIVTESEDKF